MVNEKYVKIPVELFEALCRLNFSPYESRVFHFVARQTFGWHTVNMRLNVSKLGRDIGLDRSNLRRALKSLTGRGVFNLSRHAQKGVLVSIERDTRRWLERAPKQVAFKFVIAAERGEKYQP